MRFPVCLLAAPLLLAGCVRNNYVFVVPRPAPNLAALNNAACVQPADLPPLTRSGEQLVFRKVEVPPAARQAQVSGCAGVLYRIDASGRPVDIRVVRDYPTGYGYGEAVVTALRDFRFGPSPTNGGWHYLEHSSWFRPAPVAPMPSAPGPNPFRT